MKILFVFAIAFSLLGAGCKKCVKSHQETRLVPEEPKYSYRQVGNVRRRYQSGTYPAHTVKYTVCDQYSQ